MAYISSIQSAEQVQIELFLALVAEVNKIPNVHIALDAEVDRQRDALAFAIDAVYQQFKQYDWHTALKGLPEKIRAWNTSEDPYVATHKILEFIKHLYEARILQLQQEQETPKEQREQLRSMLQLYSMTVDAILKQAKPGKTVRFSGVSESLLPSWYRNKEYLKK